MNENVSAKTMLAYLQSMLDDYMVEEKRWGPEDRVVGSKLRGMCACKDMVEALIGIPVNLQKDGKVTVGF